jgi:hypothetical protein
MNWCACNQAHDLRLLLINIDVVFLLAKHAYHQIETLGFKYKNQLACGNFYLNNCSIHSIVWGISLT